jgi:hypothetical protein
MRCEFVYKISRKCFLGFPLGEASFQLYQPYKSRSSVRRVDGSLPYKSRSSVRRVGDSIRLQSYAKNNQESTVSMQRQWLVPVQARTRHGQKYYGTFVAQLWPAAVRRGRKPLLQLVERKAAAGTPAVYDTQPSKQSTGAKALTDQITRRPNPLPVVPASLPVAVRCPSSYL